MRDPLKGPYRVWKRPGEMSRIEFSLEAAIASSFRPIALYFLTLPNGSPAGKLFFAQYNLDLEMWQANSHPYST